jgi:hypothetical protein
LKSAVRSRGAHATFEPFSALTVAALASPRIQLHTHILVFAHRNPAAGMDRQVRA